MLHSTRIALVLFAMAVGGTAQESTDDGAARRQETRAAFDEWEAAHGDGWRWFENDHTARAEFVGGGSAQGAFQPRDEADWFLAARGFIDATARITGLEGGSLFEERVRLLPLGLIGTTDKLSVRFVQRVGAVPVFEGRVNVLLDMEGNMLSIQSTALPDLGDFSTAARLDATAAMELAARAFSERTGLPGSVRGQAELGIAPHEVDRHIQPRLAWAVEVIWQVPDFEPEGFSYWIDAVDGQVLRARTLIHQLDVGGQVQTMATPGTAPDTSSNPETAAPLPYVQVSSNAGTLITDVNGNFNYPGITGPLDVTVKYFGSFADVDDVLGADYVHVTTLTGTGNTIVMNPATPEAVTSQANIYVHINKMREWIRAVDPTDDIADFQALGRANLNSTCNAYFDGSSVNFFTAGGACVNTAYSSVVAHEMGHWFNVLSATGNGNDGMGEGNSDVFAMYLYDTPIVGEGFFGPGTFIRNGINNMMFCGDCCPGCHGGQVHLEGQVWMGAAWRVREYLNLAHGNNLGDATADALFSGWMNAYDQTQIKSIIETQWLTLDDNNGNIDDGTPNYADIDQGFRDQGFPGFDLPAILYESVTQLPDTTDETGPYEIFAVAIAQISPPLVQIDINYSTDGGETWQVIQMFTSGPPDEYTETIPGQTSPTTVDYFISARDLANNVGTFPKGAPEQTLQFRVGVLTVLLQDDFEGDDDGGWTHGSFQDTPNLHDDFQRGPPTGVAGDPGSALSGDKVWGNDLGAGAWNGLYQNEQHNWLRSPTIDCSEAQNTVLSFWRWLSVENQMFDTATVSINGVEIWINSDRQDTSGSGWVFEQLDVAEICDGVPAVEIEFALASDGTRVFGGWNIDDIELVSLAEIPDGGAIGSSYCFGDGSGTACPCNNPGGADEGCANSTGAGSKLTASGSASVGADDLSFDAANLLPGQPALLFAGLNAVNNGNGVTFGDGLRCAGGTVVRLGVRIPNAQGNASWGPDLGGGGGGWGAGDTRRFQSWYRNPGGSPCSTNFNLSNGVSLDFVP